MSTTELEIHGRYDSAFTHLMAIGLASILDDDDATRCCTVRWTNANTVVVQVHSDGGGELSWNDVGDIVRSHAARWNESHWLHAQGVYSGDAARSTMAPRLGTPSDQGWRQLEQDREQLIDGLGSALDRRYLGALGEPSYWSGDRTAQGYTPDRGASRWEMVARNRGQEFIAGRLAPLADAVAKRDAKRIVDGLRGIAAVDEAGKNKDDSRTPTGLRHPSITDNAQAWCALVGVSAFPTMKSTQPKRGGSAALFQVTGQGPYAVLPIWLHPWTVDKYRAVVRSQALLIAGLDATVGGDKADACEKYGLDEATVSASWQWLAAQGVNSVMLFPQFVSDNKSAPERWLETGRRIQPPDVRTSHGR
ncbi:hypothetical protein G1C96_1258 [Bifidobacterium sp. DSM 109958]|uniref:Uncharacterized protein n=1 Tax=Bifidobacterium moraviense TaxID=2675323 RepID=A0A7Y0F2I3_9BIFI|nr:hypothetical protein [Bifidobacterium sp. DSM 109958]NMN00679.1 hypothetical protein [Bifidobacterium sp. DSM 109958]